MSVAGTRRAVRLMTALVKKTGWPADLNTIAGRFLKRSETGSAGPALAGDQGAGVRWPRPSPLYPAVPAWRSGNARGIDLARIGNFIVRDSDINRIKLELITLFKDNPGTVDSAEKISLRLGRSREEVEKALEELTNKGICHRADARPNPIYMYKPSAEILKRIAELAPGMDYNAQIELLNTLLARHKA